jgi:hypothetical protein
MVGLQTEVTQGLSRALGINYYFYCASCPQSSEKWKRQMNILKGISLSYSRIHTLHGSSYSLITLIRLRHTLGKQGLTFFESLYGRPFLTNDPFLD